MRMRTKTTQRNRWLRLLQLFVVLQLIGTSAAFAKHNPWWRSVDYKWRIPRVYGEGNLQPKLTGESHLYFSFIWYNFDGDNAYYDNSEPVWLIIDDEKVLNLTALMADQLPNWSCKIFGGSRGEGAAESCCNHDEQIAYSRFNSSKVGGGSICFVDPFRGEEKTYCLNCDMTFDQLGDGRIHKIQIWGKWRHKNGSREMMGPEVKVKAPVVTFPSNAGTIVNSGNRKARHSINGLDPQYGQSSIWHYALVDFKAKPSSKDEVEYQRQNFYGENVLADNTQNGSGEITIPSNYIPTTIYPRVRRFRAYSWKPGGGKNTERTNEISYNKDYDTIVIPGFVRPTNILLAPEQWSRNMTITWSSEGYNKAAIKNGKWVIFRESPDGTVVNLGSTDAGTMKFTHKHNDEPNYYDVRYKYYVCFLPKAWDITDISSLKSPDEMSDLYASKDTAINRAFNMSFITSGDDACVGKENTIKLNWKYSTTFADATTSNPYEVQLMHKLNGGEEEMLQTYKITNNKVKTGTYEMPSNLVHSSYDVHTFYLKVEAMDSTFASSPIDLSISGKSQVTKVEATRGNHTGMVKLYWNAVQMGGDLTYYDVYRRPLGSTDEDDYVKVYSTSGTATSYSYDDNSAQAGEYYEYKVASYIYHEFADGRKYTDPISATCDGFSLSTGVVSGRVSFGTGTAVDSVRVTLTSDGGDVVQQMRSMYFHDSGSSIVYNDTSELKKLFSEKNFAVQMYVNPSDDMIGTSASYPLLRIPGSADLSLGFYDENAKGFNLFYGTTFTGLVLEANVFSHITLSYDNNKKAVTLTVIDKANNAHEAVVALENAISLKGNKNPFVLGGAKDANEANFFKGYIDEFRVFSNQILDRKNILANYNHPLAGTEPGLSLYWPFDEGVPGQQTAYDYSKKSGVLNARHGDILNNTIPSAIIPNKDQLGLLAITDSLGNYVIRGVPFTAEGTNYIVTPTKGVHEFSPSSSTRVVSGNSLVHSGVDFTDVSSFKVSGFMYYENTTYPVEGATISVDGTVCTRDGNIVYTDDNGWFEIDVPIGKHYLTAAKDGHTFVNNGRFPNPDDYEGKTSYTFTTNMIDKLTFYDNTLVPIAGRISAGPNDEDKPLGFGLSENLLGQARITLNAGKSILNAVRKVEGSSVYYEAATTERTFDIPTSSHGIVSHTTVGAGEDGATTITITTDPNTGEFAAMVPPLLYTVTNVSVINNPNISWTDAADIDATNVLVTTTDSAIVDGTDLGFEYVASFKRSYRSTPVMKVTQDGALVDGAFGEATYTYTDYAGKEQELELYDTSDEESFAEPPVYDSYGRYNPSPYTFEYPIFVEGAWYDFRIKVYEPYKNADTGEEYLVPLQGVTVDIEGSLGSGTQVLLEDTGNFSKGDVDTEDGGYVELDENGEAVYHWMAGLPNISEDGEYVRTLSMSFYAGAVNYDWEGSGFAGIILGSLPGGNNFVTGGPDRVLMILRDPPGSASSAYIEEGTSVTTTRSSNTSVTLDNNNEMVISIGTTRQMITGAVTGGPVGSLVATSIELETESSVTTGMEIANSTNTGGSQSTETTFTKRISTSAEPEYVGALGDVFIGAATNYTYGTGTEVYINGAGELDSRETIERSDVFGTEFQYTQFYIENVLIPRFQEHRDNMIRVVSEADYVRADYPNPTEQPIYITTLPKDHENFGSDNSDEEIWGVKAVDASSLMGPSYRMVTPDSYRRNFATDKRVFADTIKWFNQQVKNWERILAANEDAKVKAIQNRSDFLQTNLSFDSGTTIEMSSSKTTSDATVLENTFSTAVTIGGATNMDLFGSGTATSNFLVTTVETTDVFENSTSKTREIGFTLAETGDDDALTVDVFTAPDGFGTIFYTAGGQTCCPYEDEVVAKYSTKYKGAVLSNKTQQIERPRIEAEKNIVSGVPSGKGATFNVWLYNDSETKEDCYFNLNVPDIENQHGANVLMDGVSLNYGRTILVPAGTRMNKVVQIFQTDENVTDFVDVPVRISSICQPDNTSTFPEIADVVYLTAHYQPAVSDVTLETQQSAVTTSTGTTVNFTIKDFDYNFENFIDLHLQCKQEGAVDWKDLNIWTKGKDNDVLQAGVINASVDMSNSRTYPDGTWIFRAITTSNIGTKYIYASEEIMLIKDTNRPQLIAMPSPSDGILDAGDEISLTFNEDIRNGQLTKPDNFYIRGELNAADVDHDVALNLSGGQGAKTDARIDLANRSWAINFWVKYTSAGHLFTHGVTGNQFDLSVNGSGKVVAKINNKSFESLSTIAPDTWTFMSLVYDGDDYSISGNIAYDGYEGVLFANQPVGEYTGNGSLVLGDNLNGQIHEVSLWDNARPWIEALSEKSVTKNRYTNGLIGYWRFNEGHGISATDKSRSRTMTLPSATAWYINAKNYSLELDGKKATAVSLSKNGTRSGESYLLELWFRADAGNSSTASIVSVGENDLDLHLTSAGALEMVASGTNYLVSSTDYRDGQWHHLALNALKSSSGNATVYVDGVALKSVSASAVPVLSADYMFLGSHRKTTGSTEYNQMLKGGIDEVRIWKQRCTADVVRSNIYNRVDPTIPELIAYYPFDLSTVDDNNIPVIKLTAEDQSATAGGTAVILNNGAATHSILDTNVVGLKPAPTKVNVAFDFVASERKILINLNESPELLEGCTVNLTVKGVMDKQDNRGESVSWDVYVRQNQLRWSNDEISIRKEMANNATFTVDIVNTGGSNENWTIENMPVWLSASAESGTLLPQSSKTITFTVDPATAPGRYEETLLLTGALGIAEPFVVNLVSAVEAPDWAVNGDDYEYNMNIVGRIQVNGAYSENSEDIVAAFNGTECVGVTHPIYFSRYDGYYVMMTIYGNETDDNANITFKLFDASTGTVYPSVSVTQNGNGLGKDGSTLNMTFKPDLLYGSLENPVLFAPEQTIEQTLALRKGWTWTSLYVTPVNPSLNNLFKDYAEVTYFKNKSAFSSVNASGSWFGELSQAMPNQMYKIKSNDKINVSVLGEPIDPKTTNVTIARDWNWIGYNCGGSANLNIAFADLSPSEGDMVKSQSQFSIYTGGEWVGTLAMLSPGMGYCYLSKANTTKTFHYPAVSNLNAMRAPARQSSSYINSDYEGNMSMVIQVKDGDEVLEGAMVAVYSEDELRGVSEKDIMVAQGDDAVATHFLTVFGRGSGDQLFFIVTYDEKDYIIPTDELYRNDAVVGSMESPFVLDLNGTTGIKSIEQDANETIYDLAGRRLPQIRQRGVYIVNGKKATK